VRTDFDPAGLDPYAFYGLLTSVIVPRPIAWVSSTSSDDVERLRPLARLGGNEWSRPWEVVRIDRIAYDDWPGHFGRAGDAEAP
jgi:hypothetical protein